MTQSATVPSYKELLDDATQLLYNESDTPRIDAEVLLQHSASVSMAWLISHGETLADANHIKDFYAAVKARQNGQPIAYITGSRDFWTLTLKVDETVLIPRPDTETLVEQALERIPSDRACQLLDLGTGSGAIALALAKDRPSSTVCAVDSQVDALQVAQANAKLNKIDNVSFVESNWFENIETTSKFDLIASNPPYVETGDPHLQQGDLRFEPDSALIAAGNGLSDLGTIIETSPNYLNSGGWLIVEHGYNQESEIASLFKHASFAQISCFRDINNLPRCTVGQFKA